MKKLLLFLIYKMNPSLKTYIWKNEPNIEIALQPPLFETKATSLDEARKNLHKKFVKIREDIANHRIGHNILSILKSSGGQPYKYASYVDNLDIFEKTIAIVNQRDPDFIFLDG